MAVAGVRWRYVVMGVAANALLVATFMLAGHAAVTLTDGEPLARLSLSGGVWLSLVSVYVLLFSVRAGIRGNRLARTAATWAGVVGIIVLLIAGQLDELALMREFDGNKERFLQEATRHVFLFGGSVLLACLIGIPLGVWAARSVRTAKPIFASTNIVQTLPSLALFGLLMAPLSALSDAFPVLDRLGIRGIGTAPAIIALVLYGLLPIVRNTFVGLRQVDPAVKDAGAGLGMGRFQLFVRLEVPLAAMLVLEGVRTSAVLAVGNTAVAALIGAGGLGHFIFQGLGQAAPDLIILGALPVIFIALVVDTGFRGVITLASPRGLRAAA